MQKHEKRNSRRSPDPGRVLQEAVNRAEVRLFRWLFPENPCNELESIYPSPLTRFRTAPQQGEPDPKAAPAGSASAAPEKAPPRNEADPPRS